MTLKELLERRAAKAAEARALVEAAEAADRSLTDEEKTNVDAMMADIEDLGERAERQRALDSIAIEHAVPGTDEVRAVVTRDESDKMRFRSFGEQLQAIARAASNPGAPIDRRLAAIEARAQEKRAILGATGTIGADGGFLVQKDFANAILDRMTSEGEILSRVTNLPLSANSDSIEIPSVDESSRATGSRYGGVQGYWLKDGAAPTASAPKFKNITLKPERVAALGYATESLLKNAPALGQLMTNAFSSELRFLAEDAIYNGDGVGKPLGIMNSNALVSVAKESGQTATTIVYENVVKAWSRLNAPLRSNAVWLANQDVGPQLNTMSLDVGTGGAPVYLPAGSASSTPFETLFGRPILNVEYSPTLGTVGDLVLADLSSYYVATKGGIESATSIHVQFTTFQQAFRVSWHIDGASSWTSALTPFKGSSTTSPFVAIATRA